MATILTTVKQLAVPNTTATSTTNFTVDSFGEIFGKTTCMHKCLLCIINPHLGLYDTALIF